MWMPSVFYKYFHTTGGEAAAPQPGLAYTPATRSDTLRHASPARLPLRVGERFPIKSSLVEPDEASVIIRVIRGEALPRAFARSRAVKKILKFARAISPNRAFVW